MEFVGIIPAGATVDLFAYDASGDVWDGSAYVAPPADGDDPTAYRIAVTEKGDGGYATLPDGWARRELRERASTYGTSYLVSVGTSASGAVPSITVNGTSIRVNDR